MLLNRSGGAIVSLLAVLKTGAAYLPMDPAHPTARMEFMLADAAPIAAVTTADLRPRLDGADLLAIDIDDPSIGAQPNTALPTPAADHVAYIIYTSGTTGKPKGVAVTHRNVTQLLESLDAEMVKDVAARFGAGATVISYEEEIANQAIDDAKQAATKQKVRGGQGDRRSRPLMHGRVIDDGVQVQPLGHQPANRVLASFEPRRVRRLGKSDPGDPGRASRY